MTQFSFLAKSLHMLSAPFPLYWLIITQDLKTSHNDKFMKFGMTLGVPFFIGNSPAQPCWTCFGLSDAECLSQMFHSLSCKQLVLSLHPLCHSSSTQPHLHTKKLLICVLSNVAFLIPVCLLNSAKLVLMFCKFVSFLEVQEEWIQDCSTNSLEMGWHELNLEWI